MADVIDGSPAERSVDEIGAVIDSQRVALIQILPGHAHERPAALPGFRVHIALGVRTSAPIPGSGLAVFTIIAGQKLPIERHAVTVLVAALARPSASPPSGAVVGDVAAMAVAVRVLPLERRIVCEQPGAITVAT